MGENEQGGMLRVIVVVGLVAIIASTIIGGVITSKASMRQRTQDMIAMVTKSVGADTDSNGVTPDASQYYEGAAIGDDKNGYDFHSDGTATLYVIDPRSAVVNHTLDIKGTVTYKGQTYKVTSTGDPSQNDNTPWVQDYQGSGQAYKTLDGKATIAYPRNDPALSDVSSLLIGEGIKDIGSGVFSVFNLHLSKLVLPESLQTIGGYTFREFQAADNTRLNIVIPKNVVSIGDSAMMMNHALGVVGTLSFEDGSKIKSIGMGAFNGLRLTSVQLPEGLETVGSYAFADHESGLHVTIPSTVTSIGENAFNTAYENADNVSTYQIAKGGHPTFGDNAFSWSPSDDNRTFVQIKPSYLS